MPFIDTGSTWEEDVIQNDAITIAGSQMIIDTRDCNAGDALRSINGGTVGDVLVLRSANSLRSINVASGYGNIQLRTTGFTLNHVNKRLRLVYNGVNWNELGHCTEANTPELNCLPDCATYTASDDRWTIVTGNAVAGDIIESSGGVYIIDFDVPADRVVTSYTYQDRALGPGSPAGFTGTWLVQFLSDTGTVLTQHVIFNGFTAYYDWWPPYAASVSQACATVRFYTNTSGPINPIQVRNMTVCFE